LQPAGTDTGLVYDGFGRITTLPSADTGNAGGNATLGYYSNDLVRTQTQAGVTLTYTLDAEARLAGHTSSTGGSWTNHYPSAGTDSPAWVAENATATAWTRNIIGLDGQLTATIDQGGAITWLVSNLHGDTTATATSTDTEPSSYYLTDEYGKPVTGYTTPARYGWLGGKQRAHDDLAGLTLMGVRLYTPTLGMFLTVDPIPGGNPNPYTYPVDPINRYDLDGRWDWGAVLSTVATVAGLAALGACIVATGGVCAVVAGAAFAASLGSRLHGTWTGDRNWRRFARGALFDAATGLIPGARGVVRGLGVIKMVGKYGYFTRGAKQYRGLSESVFNPRFRAGFSIRASANLAAFGIGRRYLND
jgi:RHS repeat-associated protein